MLPKHYVLSQLFRLPFRQISKKKFFFFFFSFIWRRSNYISLVVLTYSFRLSNNTIGTNISCICFFFIWSFFSITSCRLSKIIYYINILTHHFKPPIIYCVHVFCNIFITKIKYRIFSHVSIYYIVWSYDYCVVYLYVGTIVQQTLQRSHILSIRKLLMCHYIISNLTEPQVT